MTEFKIGDEVLYYQSILLEKNIMKRPVPLGRSFKIDRTENRPGVPTKLGTINTKLYLRSGWDSGFFTEELKLKPQLKPKLLEVVKDETA